MGQSGSDPIDISPISDAFNSVFNAPRAISDEISRANEDLKRNTAREIETIKREVTYGLGEITGANAAREQISAQKDALNEQKAALVEQQRKARLDQRNKDVQASNQASGLRMRNPQLGKASVNNDVLGDNKDYLGL